MPILDLVQNPNPWIGYWPMSNRNVGYQPSLVWMVIISEQLPSFFSIRPFRATTQNPVCPQILSCPICQWKGSVFARRNQRPGFECPRTVGSGLEPDRLGLLFQAVVFHYVRSISDLVQNPRSLLKPGWRLCLTMDTGLRRYGELLMDICFPSFQYAHSVPGHRIQCVPRYYLAPFASERGLLLR